MKKHQVGLRVDKNAFVDEGEGVVTFPQGLVITDGSEQRNGTKYDIDTLDISEYQGQLTADHVDNLDKLIAGVEGVEKLGDKVIIKKISYLVKENPLALLAYNLLVSPKVPTNFSIETMGPWPSEEDDTYYKAKLIGLSQVVLGNNRNAKLNAAIVQNSIKQAKECGMDTDELEKNFLKEIEVSQNHTDGKTENKPPVKKVNNKKDEDMKFLTVKNSRDFAVAVKYKNAAGEDTETELNPGASVDVSEDQKEAVESQISEAKNAATTDTDALLKAVNAALDAKLKPLQDQVAEFSKAENAAFNTNVDEPGFIKAENAAREYRNKNAAKEINSMAWQDRHAKQINAAWDLLKRKDSSAAAVLQSINEVNLAELKKEGVVKNSLTISDFGNFVISRELLSEIEGCRNDYTPLVNATQWKETLSTQFAWLKRQGDINMQNVEFCDDGADGNLKPISEYSATINTSDLEELAAVTPVCNAATRFLAADLLGDVAAGYRNDYDRKRAQLVIARLEQAVETNGNSVIFDTNPTVSAIVSLLRAYKEIANCTPNGTFIMNSSSHATIMEYALTAGISGPLGQIFVNGTVPTMFGRPYLIVSDDLLPSLDSAGTVTITVDGATVTVNHAVFYANLNNFTGRTSGGLMYDLSTEAAYEDNGTVKSAYQRNELVLRGSFFRGGAIKDTDQVAGILSPGVS